ncbi:MAG: CBS domain-containing protein [Methylovirgula sp.]
MIRARDVMINRVAGIHPKASVQQAVEFMADLNVSGLPVIDVSGAIVGMLTAGDVIRRAEGYEFGALPLVNTGGRKLAAKARHQAVGEVMTPELCAVQDNAPLGEVTKLMKERGIKRLPVVRGDKLVGLINRDALMSAREEDFAADSHRMTSEESAIKQAVQAALHRLKWAPTPLIDVMVQGGVVSLRGTLLQEDEREPLRSAIETIPGVDRYTDHLALADTAGDIFLPEIGEMGRRQKLY